MKPNHLLLTIVVCCCTLGSLWAQDKKVHEEPQKEQTEMQNRGCMTEVSDAVKERENNRDKEAYRQLLQRYMETETRTHRDFEIQLHIVARDNGTGGVDVEDVRSEIENFVNPYFEEINTMFIECQPENYIDDSDYYTLNSRQNGHDMADDHNREDVINIYFVGDPDGACGWARFPADPEDYIVIANNCATNQSTVVHELGHYFDVYHTHETGFGEESVTRDPGDDCYDCEDDGDLLCDTEADPRLNKDNIAITFSCDYTTDSLFVDACNGEEFDPDPENIMSYSLKSCRTVFTDGQYARMEAAMENDRDYLNSGCPCERPEAICQDITVSLDASGNATIDAEDVDDGSTAECGLASLSVTPTTFDCNDVGTNTVVLTVTDDLGWTSTCEATVTIIDDTDPEITGPAQDMTVECDGSGNVTELSNWLNNNGNASATDECGGSWSNNSTGLSDGCGATGSETVTFTFTDPSGNEASTSATFTIEDTDAPSVTCPEDIHLPECEPVATWTVETSDVCGDVSVVSDPPSGSEFPKGTTTTVTVTATDDCGNKTECTFEVERDPDLEVDIDPLETSPLNTCAFGTDANIVLGYGGGPECVTLNATASGGHDPYTYSWEAPAVVPAANYTDANTASPTFCADFQTDHCVSYTFIVTATDVHGCEETAEVEVRVVNAGMLGNGSSCTKPNNPKVAVCHTSPGKGAGEKTLCVSPNAVHAHLDPNGNAHQDDCLGDCNATCISVAPATGTSAKGSGLAGGNYDPGEAAKYDISVMPNPFNSTTEIEVSVSKAMDGELAIYDVSGKMVERLYSGPLKEDVSYYFSFDPGHLNTGIYIARFSGSDGSGKNAKLVYVK